MFFVKSVEQNPCPICDGSLKVIGSRHRGCTNSAGDAIDLIIRRLRCHDCRKIHHELPDILVPYKRHASESIEAAVTGDDYLCVAADESTIRRWRRWFEEVADLPPGLPEIDRYQARHKVCGNTIPLPRVRAFGDLALCRGRPRLAEKSCPIGGKFEFMAAYPFGVLSVTDKV